MHKKFLGIAVAAIAIVGGLALVANALRESMVFYYPVSEVVEAPDLEKHRDIRISGYVVPGTIQWKKAEGQIHFVAEDMEDKTKTIKVIQHGLEVPDMFKDHAEVVAEGSLTAPGLFESTFIMAKCPSKYETEFENAEAYDEAYAEAYGEQYSNAYGEGYETVSADEHVDDHADKPVAATNAATATY